MNCFDMMYQSYASYRPYQRQGCSVASESPPLKKWKSSRMESLFAESASSFYRTERYLQGTCEAAAAYAAGTLSGGTLTGGTITAGTLNYSRDIPSRSSSMLNREAMPDLTFNPSMWTVPQDLGQVSLKSERDCPTTDCPAYSPILTENISENCVVLTYFNGDIKSNIENHFSRSLRNYQSQDSKGSVNRTGSSCKGRMADCGEDRESQGRTNVSPGHSLKRRASCCKDSLPPLSQRNLPASFWNCPSYRSSTSGWTQRRIPHSASHLPHPCDITPHLTSGGGLTPDLYSHFNPACLQSSAAAVAALSPLHCQDPWRYSSFYSPSSYSRYSRATYPSTSPHPTLHDFTFPTAHSFPTEPRKRLPSAAAGSYRALFGHSGSSISDSTPESSTSSRDQPSLSDKCRIGGSVKGSGIWSSRHYGLEDPQPSTQSAHTLGYLPIHAGSLEIAQGVGDSHGKDLYWF